MLHVVACMMTILALIVLSHFAKPCSSVEQYEDSHELDIVDFGFYVLISGVVVPSWSELSLCLHNGIPDCLLVEST